MYLLSRLLFNALGIIVIAEFVPGITIDGLYHAIIAVIILAILNTIIRPILLLLTFPITVLTLGLFVFVVNAGLFLFVASFIEGFSVDGFVTALLGSLLLSIVNLIGSRWLRPQPPAPAASNPERSRVTYREIREETDSER